MEFAKIDLSNLIAIAHDENALGLLIDRGANLEYLEVPAPIQAYDGLQQVADLVSGAIPAVEAAESLPTPTSRCTRALSYDPETESLQIEFQNGAVYEYDTVEPEVWDELRQTRSPGHYYNQVIKGAYPSERLS
jgi:hypothetical protein